MRRKIAIFDVLGVRPEDDLPTIRKAWRRKVKEYHPDIADDKDAAAQTLVRVNAAFADLKDHTPFVERRRKVRRQSRRNKGRAWTPAERAAEAQKRAAAERGRAEKAESEARARRLAKEALQRRALERAAAAAKRAKARRSISQKEQAALANAREGYVIARQACAGGAS